MKKQYVRQLQILGDAGSLALASKATLLITGFLFLTGLFAGVFLELTMAPEEKNNVLHYLLQYLSSDNSAMDYPSPFAISALSNLLMLFILCLSGFTVFGFPVALLVLCYRGLGLGFSAGLLLESQQENGVVLLLTSLIPQNLFLIPAFLLGASGVLNYSLYHLRTRRQSIRKSRKETPGSYLILILLIALLIVIGCGVEAILYPIVLSP